MRFYLSILHASLLLFLGCKEISSSTNTAYFGGEIINPSSKLVILEKKGISTDTIKLDGRNRFLFKIDSLDTGVYTFKHGGEYQLILLEPNDSVLLRLNTLEFDESLVYTGKGSKKNNYFINEFLENENQEKQVFKLCQLTPLTYQKRLDSIKNKKLEYLEIFTKKYEASDLFKKIAKANIDFNYYSNKEMYPLFHYGKNKAQFLKELPENFYSYRKDINYNDTFFKNYHNYHIFLKSNLNNRALEAHSDHTNDDNFDWSSVCYNLDRLQLIDSLITNNELKDELLHYFTIKYISFSNNPKGNNLILESFLNKAHSEKHKTSMTNYANSIKNLEPGSTLPAFQVIDFDNNEFDFNSLVKSPTVISFWSHLYYDHFKKSYIKLNELREKYPEVKFITINIDDYGIEKPKQTFVDCKFNCNNQYLFKNPNESKKALAIYPMTKTIIIDGNQKIVSSNANMFSINFEQELLGLLNK